MVWFGLIFWQKRSLLIRAKIFFSFLVFICFLFEFCKLHFSFLLYIYIYIYCFLLFYKVLSIMSNEEMNELFYSLQQEFTSRATQIAPTWDEMLKSKHKPRRANKLIILEG